MGDFLLIGLNFGAMIGTIGSGAVAVGVLFVSTLAGLIPLLCAARWCARRSSVAAGVDETKIAAPDL